MASKKILKMSIVRALICITSVASAAALAGNNRLLRMATTMNGVGTSTWSPASWSAFPIKQPPNYPNPQHTQEVVEKLTKYSPLVFAGEVRTLQEQVNYKYSQRKLCILIAVLHCSAC